MRMHRTKEILDETLIRLNAVVTDEQRLALYETVNDRFFAVVEPIFQKTDILDIQDENFCEIIKELDLDYEDDTLKAVRVKTRELLPTSYLLAYTEYCEYEITKQTKRNMDIIKGLGVENIEVDPIEEPDLYEKFFFLSNVLIT